MEPTPVTTSYIELRDSPSGRKAYIAGSRISVRDVYVAHELMGKSPDEMVEAWPHRTLSEIHAALAYFYENAREIREQDRAGREFAEKCEREAGPSLLQQRLERMRQEGDAVSR